MAILREDYHYSYPFIHWVFAISALLLLATSIWMILDDYYSPWKDIQQKGQKIQYLKKAENFDRKLAEIDNKIDRNQARLKEKKKQVLQTYRESFDEGEDVSSVKDLQARLNKLKEQLGNREDRRAKADSKLRELRARQELHIREEGEPDSELQQKISKQKEEIERLEVKKEEKQEQVDRYQQLLEPVLALEREISSLKNQRENSRSELQALNPDATPTAIRNSPILNFASPTIRPRQIVLEHIKDDYNYTKTRKVDRCQTCHLNIDTPGYESVRDFDAYFDAEYENLSNESIEKRISAIDKLLYRRTNEQTVNNSKKDEYPDREVKKYLDQFEDTGEEELRSKRSSLLQKNENKWEERKEKFEEENLGVYKTHPKMDLFLGANSPHPVKQYGCTICHKGRGREMNFARAAHTPSNEEEKKEWKKEHDWEKQEHWHKPMVPSKHMEASCWQCHKEQESTPFAEDANRGEKLIRRKGCYGCHQIEGFEDLPNPGPSLKKITTKLDKEWVYRWINEPSAFKHSRMPDFYGLTNDSAEGLGLKEGSNTPASKFPEFNEVEILAIREYLWEQSEKPEDWESLPEDMTADADNGEKLFNQVGCKGCHGVNMDFSTSNAEENWPLGYGFDLGTIAEKAAGNDKKFREWLYNWIRNPERYDKNARMPNLHLTKQQALDITEYIMTNDQFKGIRKKEEFNGITVPSPSERESALNALIKKQLKVNHPSDRVERIINVMGGKSVENQATLMEYFPDIRKTIKNYDDPYKRKLVWLGEKMIRTRGCANCHAINGMEDAGKIGAALTGSSSVGNKPLFMFSFGNLDKHKLPKNAKLKKKLKKKGWLLEHNRWSWLDQKLAHPRSFDFGVPDLDYRSKLKMPKYEWAEGEREAIVTFLMGLTNREIPGELQVNPSGKEKTIEQGKRIARTKNCIGCHRVGTQLRDVVIREPGEKKVGQEATDGPLLEAEMSPSMLGSIMRNNQDHPFLNQWRNNQSKQNLPWLGGYLLWNPDKERAFYRLDLSDQDRKTMKKRGVEIIAKKGEYIDVDLLLKILKYGYERIPVRALSEGNIRMAGDLMAGASPPSLKSAGEKIQSRWLFSFLKAPHKNKWRRKMITNMPNYGLSDDEVLTISQYLYYRNGETYPYESQEEFTLTEEERETARKIVFGTDEQPAQCQACHGNPSQATPAPSLLKSKNRTKRSWFEKGWLVRPREMEPGVVMNAVPALKDPEKEEAVIKYLYNLTEEEFHKQTGEKE